MSVHHLLKTTALDCWWFLHPVASNAKTVSMRSYFAISLANVSVSNEINFLKKMRNFEKFLPLQFQPKLGKSVLKSIGGQSLVRQNVGIVILANRVFEMVEKSGIDRYISFGFDAGRLVQISGILLFCTADAASVRLMSSWFGVYVRVRMTYVTTAHISLVFMHHRKPVDQDKNYCDATTLFTSNPFRQPQC